MGLTGFPNLLRQAVSGLSSETYRAVAGWLDEVISDDTSAKALAGMLSLHTHVSGNLGDRLAGFNRRILAGISEFPEGLEQLPIKTPPKKADTSELDVALEFGDLLANAQVVAPAAAKQKTAAAQEAEDQRNSVLYAADRILDIAYPDITSNELAGAQMLIQRVVTMTADQLQAYMMSNPEEQAFALRLARTIQKSVDPVMMNELAFTPLVPGRKDERINFAPKVYQAIGLVEDGWRQDPTRPLVDRALAMLDVMPDFQGPAAIEAALMIVGADPTELRSMIALGEVPIETALLGTKALREIHEGKTPFGAWARKAAAQEEFAANTTSNVAFAGRQDMSALVAMLYRDKKADIGRLQAAATKEVASSWENLKTYEDTDSGLAEDTVELDEDGIPRALETAPPEDIASQVRSLVALAHGNKSATDIVNTNGDISKLADILVDASGDMTVVVDAAIAEVEGTRSEEDARTQVLRGVREILRAAGALTTKAEFGTTSLPGIGTIKPWELYKISGQPESTSMPADESQATRSLDSLYQLISISGINMEAWDDLNAGLVLYKKGHARIFLGELGQNTGSRQHVQALSEYYATSAMRNTPVGEQAGRLPHNVFRFLKVDVDPTTLTYGQLAGYYKEYLNSFKKPHPNLYLSASGTMRAWAGDQVRGFRAFLRVRAPEWLQDKATVQYNQWMTGTVGRGLPPAMQDKYLRWAGLAEDGKAIPPDLLERTRFLYKRLVADGADKAALALQIREWKKGGTVNGLYDPGTPAALDDRPKSYESHPVYQLVAQRVREHGVNEAKAALAEQADNFLQYEVAIERTEQAARDAKAALDQDKAAFYEKTVRPLKAEVKASAEDLGLRGTDNPLLGLRAANYKHSRLLRRLHEANKAYEAKSSPELKANLKAAEAERRAVVGESITAAQADKTPLIYDQFRADTATYYSRRHMAETNPYLLLNYPNNKKKRDDEIERQIDYLELSDHYASLEKRRAEARDERAGYLDAPTFGRGRDVVNQEQIDMLGFGYDAPEGASILASDSTRARLGMSVDVFHPGSVHAAREILRIAAAYDPAAIAREDRILDARAKETLELLGIPPTAHPRAAFGEYMKGLVKRREVAAPDVASLDRILTSVKRRGKPKIHTKENVSQADTISAAEQIVERANGDQVIPPSLSSMLPDDAETLRGRDVFVVSKAPALRGILASLDGVANGIYGEAIDHAGFNKALSEMIISKPDMIIYLEKPEFEAQVIGVIRGASEANPGAKVVTRPTPTRASIDALMEGDVPAAGALAKLYGLPIDKPKDIAARTYRDIVSAGQDKTRVVLGAVRKASPKAADALKKVRQVVVAEWDEALGQVSGADVARRDPRGFPVFKEEAEVQRAIRNMRRKAGEVLREVFGRNHRIEVAAPTYAQQEDGTWVYVDTNGMGNEKATIAAQASNNGKDFVLRLGAQLLLSTESTQWEILSHEAGHLAAFTAALDPKSEALMARLAVEWLDYLRRGAPVSENYFHNTGVGAGEKLVGPNLGPIAGADPDRIAYTASFNEWAANQLGAAIYQAMSAKSPAMAAARERETVNAIEMKRRANQAYQDELLIWKARDRANKALRETSKPGETIYTVDIGPPPVPPNPEAFAPAHQLIADERSGKPVSQGAYNLYAMLKGLNHRGVAVADQITPQPHVDLAVAIQNVLDEGRVADRDARQNETQQDQTDRTEDNQQAAQQNKKAADTIEEDAATASRKMKDDLGAASRAAEKMRHRAALSKSAADAIKRKADLAKAAADAKVGNAALAAAMKRTAAVVEKAEAKAEADAKAAQDAEAAAIEAVGNLAAAKQAQNAAATAAVEANSQVEQTNSVPPAEQNANIPPIPPTPPVSQAAAAPSGKGKKPAQPGTPAQGPTNAHLTLLNAAANQAHASLANTPGPQGAVARNQVGLQWLAQIMSSGRPSGPAFVGAMSVFGRNLFSDRGWTMLGKIARRPEMHTKLTAYLRQKYPDVDDFRAVMGKVIESADTAIAVMLEARLAGEIEFETRMDSIFRTTLHRISTIRGLRPESLAMEEMFSQMTATANSPPAGPVVFEYNDKLADKAYQRLFHKVDELFAPIAEQFGKWWKTIGNRLREMDNPTKEWLAEIVDPSPGNPNEGVFQAIRRNQFEFLNQLDGVFDSLSPASQSKVNAALMRSQTKGGPDLFGSLTPAEKKAAGQVRTTLRRVWAYVDAAGVDMGRTGATYYPLVLDADWLLKNRQEAIDKLARVYPVKLMQEADRVNAAKTKRMQDARNSPATIDAAMIKTPKEMAEKIINGLIDNGGLMDDSTVVATGDQYLPGFRFGNRNMMRMLFEPDTAVPGSEETRDWFSAGFSDDMPNVLISYIRSATKRAEFARRFGADNKELQRKIQEGLSFDPHMDLVQVNRLLDAVFGVSGIETNQKMYRMFGKEAPRGEVINPVLQTVIGYISAIVYTQILSMATITSIADIAGISARVGGDMNITGRAVLDGLKALARRPDVHARDLSEMMGQIGTRAMTQMIASRYDHVFVKGAPQRLINRFFRLIGLQEWTMISQIMSMSGSEQFIVKLNNLGWTNPETKRLLGEELGLRQSDVASVLSGNGKQINLMTIEEREAATRRGDHAAVAAEERIRIALNSLSKSMVVTPDAGKAPAWYANPFFALARMLHGFTYTFYYTVVAVARHEVNHNNSQVMLTLAGVLIPLTVMTVALQDMLKGYDDPAWRFQKYGLFGYTFEAASRSGLFGPAGFINDLASDLEYGNYGTSTFLGPWTGSVTNVYKYVAEDDEVLSQKAGLSLLPFGNLLRPWIMQ